MDKILIVGHPQSGHDTIAHMAIAAGMAPARPSRREGLRPDEIGSALCRADARTLLEAPEADGALRQLDIGPVWQGLALDLMLGNIDQPVWGWSDPQSVVLLDYWRTIDPDLTFVLVYDVPDSVLVDMPAAQATQLSPDRLRRLLHNWSAFNATLLRFFLHHPGRCLLVQSRQARHAPQSWLQQLQGRLHGTTPLQTEAVVPPPDRSQATDPALTFLTAALLREHPDCQHLYEALQACANLPEAGTAADAPPTPLAAWLALAGLHQDRLELGRHLAEQAHRIDTLGQGLAHRDTLLQQQQQQARQLETQAQASQQEQVRLSGQIDHLHRALDTQTQERQQLTTQVQSLTEALQRIECVASGHQAHATQLDLQLHQQAQTLSGREEALQAAQARIGELQADQAQQAQSHQQDQERLIGQLHQIQLNLEAHYLQRQQLNAEVVALKSELQRTGDLAAERQSQIVRLNQQLDQHTRRLADQASELDMAATRLAQWQESQTRQEQEQIRQEAARKATEERITRLIQKGDRLQAQMQAQKDRHHARLQEATAASAALAQENTRLVAQVHRVQQELERHFLDLQSLRQAQARAAAAVPPAPVGAAERVRSHLSYRLGATMIQHSGSVTGWLSMPYALLKTTHQYRREHRARAAVKLPPLHRYRDAQEAERVKRHLSYRLGQTLVRHASTPLGWISLPFALQREVKDFRLQRQP